MAGKDIRSRTGLIRTNATVMVQSSDPIVLDTHILDINRNVMTIDVTAKKVAAKTTSSAERFGCGRSQVAACTFARTKLLENIWSIDTENPLSWSCIVQFSSRHADVNTERVLLLHWQAVSANEQLASGTVNSRQESCRTLARDRLDIEMEKQTPHVVMFAIDHC